MPDGEGSRRESALRVWLPWLALGFLTAIVALQETRWAPLPTRNERALWLSVALALASALSLRLGWRADGDWEARQRALGTLSNSFYGPRRQALLEGGAVLGGIVGALWWGAMAWIVLANGIRHHSPVDGLLDLQAATLVGVSTGALVGALCGRIGGSVWETRHRARRGLLAR